MADKEIEIEVHSEDALRGIDHAYATAFGGARHIIDQLADVGVHLLEANVPIYTSYTLRHVERTGAVWRPGGAGGGGQWEAWVGVKAGTSMHPLYADQGTGIYGTFKRPYTGKGSEIVRLGRSTPMEVPSRMWFFSHLYGKVIGVREVQGQPAQHFLYRTFAELQPYVKARLLVR
jgi:hypothetical protein